MAPVTTSMLTSQLYLKDEDEVRHCLEDCICDIMNWMRINHMKLNDSNIEFIMFMYHTELYHVSGNDGIKIETP